MKIAFIYMASGFGSRFGSNKLLAWFGDRELYRCGLECLIRASETLRSEDGYDTEVVVVSQYNEILDQASLWGLKAVHNKYSAEGITASLRLGTEAAGEETDLYLFSVADQPYMEASTLAGFLRGFIGSGRGIGCLCHNGRRGNPAVFNSSYRSELLSLTGDRGGSVIMKSHPEDVWTMEAPEGELKDIDRAEDLAGGRPEPSDPNRQAQTVRPKPSGPNRQT